MSDETPPPWVMVLVWAALCLVGAVLWLLVGWEAPLILLGIAVIGFPDLVLLPILWTWRAAKARRDPSLGKD